MTKKEGDSFLLSKTIFSKKAQITFFIIIGIILLISLVTFIYITYLPSPEEKAELTEFIEEVPVEFQPIQSFVQQCLYDTSVRGLEEIGRHGGYISPDDSRLVFNNLEPTEADGFYIFPNDARTAVPYWLYFKSSNNCRSGCQCASMKPPLYNEFGPKSIEAQMNSYIESNLQYCIRDFLSFRGKGIDIEAGNLKSDIIVRQSDVFASLKYPIAADANGVKSEFESFYAVVPVNLRLIYELAEGITDLEQEFHYLERWTIDLVEASSFGLKEAGMPPSFANTFDPGAAPAYWSKTKSKDLLVNNILAPNVPFFQVWATDNYRERPSAFYQKAVLAYQSPTNSSYYDLSVDFEYLPFWPVYYDITGRGVKGDMLGPEKVSLGPLQFIGSLFSFLGINRYSFYHDISYPVKIDIYDPYALNNKGYHFIFGLETNVRDNKPLNCSGEGRDIVAPPTGSLMCNPGNGCANITIVTVDELTGLPVEDALLIYGAGAESCTLGVAKYNNITLRAEADVEMPFCVGSGCTLSVSKPGYSSIPQNLAVRCGMADICSNPSVLCNGETVVFNLSRYIPVNITILKKPMLKSMIATREGVNYTWQFRDEARKLLPYETALLRLDRIKESDEEEDFSVVASVNGTHSKAEIYPGLVPGNYEVSIDLLYYLPDITGRKAVVFKAVEECVEGGLFKGEECFTLGPHEFNETFIEGGARYNLTLTWDDIMAGKITFYAISSPDSATFNQLDFNDMEMMQKIDKLSQEHLSAIMPVFG